MKWAIREAVDVYFKAKSVFKLGARTIRAGEPVLIFDTVKTSTLEVAAEVSYVTGGRGNARLLSYEGDKTLTFNFEDALLSAEGLAILSGADLIPARNKHLVGSSPEARSVISHYTEKYSVVTNNMIDDDYTNTYPDDPALYAPNYKGGKAAKDNYSNKGDYSPRGGVLNVWLSRKPYVGQNASIYVMLLDDAGEMSGVPLEINLACNPADYGADGDHYAYLAKWKAGDRFVAFGNDGNPIPRRAFVGKKDGIVDPATNRADEGESGFGTARNDASANAYFAIRKDPVTAYACGEFDDNVAHYVDLESAKKFWVTGWGDINAYVRVITAPNYGDTWGATLNSIDYGKDGGAFGTGTYAVHQYIRTNNDVVGNSGLADADITAVMKALATEAAIYDTNPALELDGASETDKPVTYALLNARALPEYYFDPRDAFNRGKDTDAVNEGASEYGFYSYLLAPSGGIAQPKGFKEGTQFVYKVNVPSILYQDIVLLDYYVEYQHDATQVSILPDKFGPYLYVEGSSLVRRASDGMDLPVEFVIPKFKVTTALTFTLTGTGDASTFTFQGDAYPDFSKFDLTRKVLADIQILDADDNYDGATGDAATADPTSYRRYKYNNDSDGEYLWKDPSLEPHQNLDFSDAQDLNHGAGRHAKGTDGAYTEQNNTYGDTYGGPATRTPGRGLIDTLNNEQIEVDPNKALDSVTPGMKPTGIPGFGQLNQTATVDGRVKQNVGDLEGYGAKAAQNNNPATGNDLSSANFAGNTGFPVFTTSKAVSESGVGRDTLNESVNQPTKTQPGITPTNRDLPADGGVTPPAGGGTGDPGQGNG